jgi:hypothetical protein
MAVKIRFILFILTLSMFTSNSFAVTDYLINGTFSSSGGGWSGATGGSGCTSGIPSLGSWAANALTFSYVQNSVSQSISIPNPGVVTFTITANRGWNSNGTYTVTLADSNESKNFTQTSGAGTFSLSVSTTSSNENVTVTISGKDGMGWAGCYGPGFTNASLTATEVTPVNSTLPTISGTTSFGQTLTSSNGTWSGSPTYTYQWSRASTSGGTYAVISGATSSSYSLTTADIGQFLKVAVTATNGAGAATATSLPTSQINKASQSISITSLGTSSKTYPYSQSLSISTSGTTGNGSTYFSISNGTALNCSLSDTASATSRVIASTSGTCLITATINADTNYLLANSSPSIFTFNKANQSPISITSTSVRYGNSLALVATGGSTGGSYSYIYSSGSCTLAGSNLNPTAVGTCLIYATLLSDVNYLQETSTATTITISRGLSTAEMSASNSKFVYRTLNLLSVVTSSTGSVTYKVNGKNIPGCIKLASKVANAYTTTCSYLPSFLGQISITAFFNPTDTLIDGATTKLGNVFVNRRTNLR